MFSKLQNAMNALSLRQPVAKNADDLSACATRSLVASLSSPAPAPRRLRLVGRFWSKAIEAHVFHHRDREKREQQANFVYTRSEVFTDPLATSASDGDRRLAMLLYWLNNIGDIKRSPDQCKFHTYFTNACLPHIYGEKEWNEKSVRVMQERGLTRIRYEVTAITPRRYVPIRFYID